MLFELYFECLYNIFMPKAMLKPSNWFKSLTNREKYLSEQVFLSIEETKKKSLD